MSVFDGRIALIAPNLASYPEGGGHWSWFLQYAYGLRELNVDFFWLEFIPNTAPPQALELKIRKSLKMIAEHGLLENYRLVLHDVLHCDLASGDTIILGGEGQSVRQIIASCDAAWSFAGAGPLEILTQFKRVVLIDGDPGLFQVATIQLQQNLDHFDVCCTVGLNYNSKSCIAPRLGRRWVTFPQVLHLPFWPPIHEDPSPDSPVTTITSWTWEWLEYQDKLISISKRDAYLRYLDLPLNCSKSFQLAVDVGDDSKIQDTSLLRLHGWNIVDPCKVVGSISAYRSYIQNSAAELCCPKPVYRELRTGWMSDRSAAYLASGRPVIMEETGFDFSSIANGGLLTFHDLESAAEAITLVFSDYNHHSRQARSIAEELCSGRRVLPMLLEQTFASFSDQKV